MNEKVLAAVERRILYYYDTHPVLPDAWGVAIDNRHVRHYLDIGRQRFKILIEYIEASIPQGARILEVGAGYSVVLLYLKEIGYHVQASELPQCLDAFSSVLIDQKIQVTPWDLHHSAEPLAGQHFDAVLASEILEHVQMSLKSAIGRLAPLLASDGRLIVTTPNLYRMNNLLKIVRGHNICEPFGDSAVMRNGVVVDNRTHPREPVRAELVQAMTANRLCITHADMFNSHPRGRLVRWLYTVCPERFRDHIMLVGRPKTSG
jgi:2-polyprenyl-3-methyl-5-hydroxy-6-metoxy-1,4-benzoquinol methylase